MSTSAIDRLNAALSGRYEIERELGEGGMATVYLAKDLKHNRPVALKVLKPELAAVVGAERFLAEIETTANLQHPHILPLFDSGEADKFLYYVMPYIEGETLRDRIDREKQLPVDEALGIATAVANALHTAHDAGIIHRDIKPGNILLSRGEPLVADFGIALAVGAAGGGRLTETGLSIGTPYYMSPEQATGDQAVGASSDTFALACVLYEMLTGEPPYPGTTAQAVLGKIIQGLPVSATAVRKSIPLNVDAAIRKALEKIPADRFTSAHAFAKALGDSGFRHGEEQAAPTASRSAWTIAMTAVAAAAAGLAFGWNLAPAGAGSDAVVRQRLEPLGEGVARPVGTHMAIAPDGSSMVYASAEDAGGDWSLYLKPRGSADGVRLPGTELGKNPAYSPDAQWIVFQSGGRLLKKHLEDGSIVTLAEGLSTGETGLAWLDDGTIVYEPLATMTLVQIPESGGGEPDTIAHFPGGHITSVDPLPDGRGLLVGTCRTATCAGGMDLFVADLESDTLYLAVADAARGWYTSTGHVLYARLDGSVLAAPFDLETMSVTGAGTPLLEGVHVVNSSAQLALGDDGTLVFLEGTTVAAFRTVVWVDRDGREEAVSTSLQGLVFNVALSPDDRRLAVSFAPNPGEIAQLWVKELPDGALTRLTTDVGFTRRPVWFDDGRSIAYVTNDADAELGAFESRTIRADGSSAGAYDVLLAAADQFSVMEIDFTTDEGGIVFRRGNANQGQGDLGYLNLSTGEIRDGLLSSSFNERAVSLSPDGRWMVYVSNASGRDDVFVRPFPDVAARRFPVSSVGGSNPVWSRTGNALYYIDSEEWLVEATYRATAEGFVVERQERLFDATQYYQYSPDWRRFDVTSDGERFVMIRPLTTTTQRGPVLIQNFFAEIERRLGS
jgi:serine/threonine-protein kinase